MEELSTGLGLKTVVSVLGLLVDGGLQGRVFWLTFSRGDDNVKDEDVVDVEFVFIDLLVEGFGINDNVVTIDQVLLDIVG